MTLNVSRLTLAEAEAVVDGVLASATRRGLKPLGVCVLDEGGHVLIVKRQDGATLLRVDVCHAKAWSAVALGTPTRNFAAMAEARPEFATSLVTISQGRMAPAAGGVTIVVDGLVVGSVGVSGDTPENDEAVAIDGIEAAGLLPGE